MNGRGAGRVAEGLQSLDREQDILEPLVAEHPGNALYRKQLSQNYGQLGEIQANAGLTSQALALANACGGPARPLGERRTGQRPLPAAAWGRSRPTPAGSFPTRGGRPKGCRTWSGACRSWRKWRATTRPSPVSNARWPSATTSSGRPRPGSATGTRRPRALGPGPETLERLIADHPDFIAYQADLAENHLWTGVVYQDSGRTADALREFTSAHLAGADGARDRQPLRPGPDRVPARPPDQVVRARASGGSGDGGPARAVARGYRAIDVLRTDPCLDALRSRPDFKTSCSTSRSPTHPFAP